MWERGRAREKRGERRERGERAYEGEIEGKRRRVRKKDRQGER